MDYDDIDDFTKITKKWIETSLEKPIQGRPLMGDTVESKKPEPGAPTQYALYGPGYVATNSTIKSLPAGCYDIKADNKTVFVHPMAKPAGLLLELPEMRSDDVIKIVETFWNSEKDYKEGNEFVIGGAAYRAGIMLYGPPGSGKSSTIKIVNNKLIDRGGTVFYSSCYPTITMDFLSDFSKIEKNRKSIVILEDIDSLIDNFGESLYLEMLDSAKTIDNVLFIATTNYPDKLDPRIYNRPGRFSHVVKIGLPTKKAREAYLKAILKNYKDVEQIVEKSEGFTVDHLNSLCNAVYREKKELKDELERLRRLFKIPVAEEHKSMGL